MSCKRPCAAITFHACVGVVAIGDCVYTCVCVWVVRDTVWTLPLAVCCIGPLQVVDEVAVDVVAVHAVGAMVKS